MAELTVKQSLEYVRELMKKPSNIRKADLQPGNVLFYKYDAKDKTQVYDKTPLVLVLRVSRTYMLGLNLHWLPYQKRAWLVDQMLRISKFDMKRGKKIRFTYEDFKPLQKSVHYQPCIRLYIRKRISERGVLIPPQDLKTAVKLRAETFTGGKRSAQEMYRLAKLRGTNRAKQSQRK